MPQAHEEARKAIQMLREHASTTDSDALPREGKNQTCKESRRVLTYDEARPYVLAKALSDTVRNANVIPAALRKAWEHDAHHGTEYARTVLAFSHNLRNKTTTCEELMIHRSTLDYRLERIHSLFQLDIDNPQTFQHLLLIAWASMNTRPGQTHETDNASQNAPSYSGQH